MVSSTITRIGVRVISTDPQTNNMNPGTVQLESDGCANISRENLIPYKVEVVDPRKLYNIPRMS